MKNIKNFMGCKDLKISFILETKIKLWKRSIIKITKQFVKKVIYR